jgi:tetratricopeptide (TPR) repeat protein
VAVEQDMKLEAAPDDPLIPAIKAYQAKDFAAAALALESLLEAGGPHTRNDFDRIHLQLRLAASYIEIGRNQDAIDILDEVLPFCPEVSRPVSRCFALLTRGRAGVRVREMEQSAADLSAALVLAEQLNVPLWQGTAAIALSVISRLQMDLEQALEWRERALASFEAAGDLPGQALALHYIGTIHAMQGDLTRAMGFFTRALAFSRQTGDQRVLGAVLGEMANICDRAHPGSHRRADRATGDPACPFSSSG